MNTNITIALGLLLMAPVVAAERAVPAAPPANDLSSGATLVTVGFSESLDTSEATTDAEDTEMNSRLSSCVPATSASVWYKFVGNGQGVIVNVVQSNYQAGILVLPGNPGNWRYGIGACGYGEVPFLASSGETYYILVTDYLRDGVG